jgi:hypothetical protein
VSSSTINKLIDKGINRLLDRRIVEAVVSPSISVANLMVGLSVLAAADYVRWRIGESQTMVPLDMAIETTVMKVLDTADVVRMTVNKVVSRVKGQ